MTIDDAARGLASDYANAAEGQKVVAIHLFAIGHARHLDGMPLKEIAARAGLPPSYGAELRKGINLSRFVEIKK